MEILTFHVGVECVENFVAGFRRVRGLAEAGATITPGLDGHVHVAGPPEVLAMLLDMAERITGLKAAMMPMAPGSTEVH